MDKEQLEQLDKDINRLNAEGFVPKGKELRLFRTSDDLIEAIRKNEIPGIPWTSQHEEMWQASEALEKAFKIPTEEVETSCDEFNAPTNDWEYVHDNEILPGDLEVQNLFENSELFPEDEIVQGGAMFNFEEEEGPEI